MIDTDWIDLQETARMLATPYQTVYSWAVTGVLRAERHAGRWWVHRDAIEAKKADQARQRRKGD